MKQEKKNKKNKVSKIRKTSKIDNTCNLPKWKADMIIKLKRMSIKNKREAEEQNAK